MLVFDLDQNLGRLRLNPEMVDAIVEIERLGRAGTHLLAEVVLRNGVRYVVCDPERKTAETILVAAEACHRERQTAMDRTAKALEALGLPGE